mmetsp:Transcript_11005/g.50956  ORF Transcript_11005/g.50956 Transcript_11005/m.50956 type:complete len:228 (-) Transcript_11005:1335-2018(-)
MREVSLLLLRVAAALLPTLLPTLRRLRELLVEGIVEGVARAGLVPFALAPVLGIGSRLGRGSLGMRQFLVVVILADDHRALGMREILLRGLWMRELRLGRRYVGLAVGLWLAFEPREHPAAGGGRLAERARAGPRGGPPFKRRELLIRTRGTLRGFTPRADLRGRRRGLALLTLGERPVDDNLGNDAGLDVGVVNASVVSFIPEPRVHAAPAVAPAAGRAVHLRAGL